MCLISQLRLVCRLFGSCEADGAASGVGKSKDARNWRWSDGDDSHNARILALFGANS